MDVCVWDQRGFLCLQEVQRLQERSAAAEQALAQAQESSQQELQQRALEQESRAREAEDALQQVRAERDSLSKDLKDAKVGL